MNRRAWLALALFLALTAQVTIAPNLGNLPGIVPIASGGTGSTTPGEKGVRDEALSADGRFLYALDADARRVFAFAVRHDGRLDPVGDVDGLPATAAGLAAV